jgi:hypothetical protein
MADTIAEMFPQARFLHILRDGRRVVNSMIHFLDIRHGEAKAKLIAGGFVPKWASDFREACRTWCSYVQAMNNFEKRQGDRCLTVINEELVADGAPVFARVFEFLGIPDEEGPAVYFQANRHNSSFEPDSRVPMTVEKLSRPWDAWSFEQQRVFAEEAGPTLVELGFASPEELEIDAAAAAPRYRA